MKILHLCLASFYIDNYSYQENMLPKFHKMAGFDVEIIASLVSFDSNGLPCILEKGGSYINEYGIPVTRLEYQEMIFSKIFRRYKGTYKAIKESNPDIIFIHGSQFLDMYKIVKYIKKNPKVKVYVDNHADFSNSARNFLSKNILHKIVWKYSTMLIEPYTTKFYGVIPARVDFLLDVYKTPIEKTELLVMGADDDKIDFYNKDKIRLKIRNKYNIDSNDFLIITGGKIDSAKIQTLLLMKAIYKISNKRVKLIVFGSVTPELNKEFNDLIDNDRVKYIGWISSEDVYDYFLASDIGVFPGRHSVLWEQAVATGLPCIFRYWDGTTHVDLGGNCKFLYNDSVDEIYELLDSLLIDKLILNQMKSIAEDKGTKYFSYKNISLRAIDIR